MKSITVIADDEIGLLADMSYVLGKAKINIDSIRGDVVSKKAIVTLFLSDPEKAKRVLTEAGYTVMEFNTVVIKLNDEPGELSKITKMLSDSGINIQNVHVVSKSDKATVLSITVDTPKKAMNVLKDCLVTNESIY